MSEVKRYGHISHLVGATPQILELYPSMTVYVLATDYDASQVELAALREELAEQRKLKLILAERVQNAEDNCSVYRVRLKAAEQRNAELETALKFYADGDHLLLADPDEWDTCSGEPINWLHDAAGTASVEDGSVAKQALTKLTESVSDACTSCDGSGEYIDAIGDWRGYCSCHAGVALKNKPTESGASE